MVRCGVVRRLVGVEAGGQAFSRHIDTEIDIILKRLLAMVALRLQLQHRSLSPIRLSIIHVMDFMGFSRYFRPY